MIPTSSKCFRRFWSGFFALLLLAVVALGAANSPMWASPPDGLPLPQTPPIDIEPFSFRLEEPPGGTAPTVTAASVHPTAGGDWFELISSGFEQDFQSEGWEVQGTGWNRSGTRKNSGGYSAAIENFTGTPVTWLVYGGESGFSLSEWTDAKLNFNFWLDTETNTFFGWAASADGMSFYGARTSGRVQRWLPGSLDLKHLIGDSSVWIAFAISGDGNGTNQNVFLDDVVIRTQEPYWTYLPETFKNYVPPFPDFYDDFSDPSTGWPREHVNGLPQYEAHRDYSNEYGTTYRMKLGGWTWFHRLFASPENVHSRDDFTLQTDIMYDLGDYRAEWSLIFEASDDMESYYMVALYRYGPYVWYRIRRRTPSEGEVELVPNAVAPGYLNCSKGCWSTIRVVREGNSIAFYARHPWGHWDLVKSTSNAPPLSGDRVGFTIFNSELGSDAWFDNFYLWQRPSHP